MGTLEGNVWEASGRMGCTHPGFQAPSKKPFLLSQFYQQESQGGFQLRSMPESGSVPFFSRAKVPRYLLRGQPRASSVRGQRPSPAQTWELPWWLGRDTQPQPADTKHDPPAAGIEPSVPPQSTAENLSWGPNFGHFKWEQK